MLWDTFSPVDFWITPSGGKAQGTIGDIEDGTPAICVQGKRSPHCPISAAQDFLFTYSFIWGFYSLGHMQQCSGGRD